MPNLWPNVRDTVRSQLWPLPVAAVALALAAGFLLPQLDAHVDASVPSWLAGVLFGGDADAGRTVLDAVSSSLITVTSLTFSLTVVTLQLASSQFSPRLLRTFTSDVFVQATLGLFLATFTYSLTVLRAVRSGGDSAEPFVPRISITVSFVLAVASVVGLVVFLAHLARQIRVETMLRDVHQDASATVRVVFDDEGAERPQPPETPERAAVLVAGNSGFLVRIDHSDLLAAARAADAVVVITAHPGSWVIEKTPIGQAWYPAGVLRAEGLQGLRTAVKDAITVGFERTAAQDVGYGLPLRTHHNAAAHRAPCSLDRDVSVRGRQAFRAERTTVGASRTCRRASGTAFPWMSSTPVTYLTAADTAAASGIEMMAPVIPASTEPAVKAIRMTTGCNLTVRPMISGW